VAQALLLNGQGISRKQDGMGSACRRLVARLARAMEAI
jgi:hypothetical protein